LPGGHDSRDHGESRTASVTISRLGCIARRIDDVEQDDQDGNPEQVSVAEDQLEAAIPSQRLASRVCA